MNSDKKVLKEINVAVEKETITQFIKADNTTQKILTEKANNVKGFNFRDLFPWTWYPSS